VCGGWKSEDPADEPDELRRLIANAYCMVEAPRISVSHAARRKMLLRNSFALRSGPVLQ